MFENEATKDKRQISKLKSQIKPVKASLMPPSFSVLVFQEPPNISLHPDFLLN